MGPLVLVFLIGLIASTYWLMTIWPWSLLVIIVVYYLMAGVVLYAEAREDDGRPLFKRRKNKMQNDKDVKS